MLRRAAIACAVLLACSRDYGATTSVDAGPGDPVDARDASVDDATSPVLDAGADASGPFCSSVVPAPFFCADFDEGKPVDYGFNLRSGDVSIDTSTSTSAPGSLRAGATGDSLLIRDWPKGPGVPAQQIQLSFAILWGDANGVPPGAVPVRISSHDVTSCAFDFQYGSGAWQASLRTTLPDGGAGYSSSTTVPFFPLQNQWSRVVFTLKTSAQGNGSVVLMVDGNQALAVADFPCPSLGDLHLVIGGEYATQSVVHLDDVVLDGN